MGAQRTRRLPRYRIVCFDVHSAKRHDVRVRVRGFGARHGYGRARGGGGLGTFPG